MLLQTGVVDRCYCQEFLDCHRRRGNWLSLHQWCDWCTTYQPVDFRHAAGHAQPLLPSRWGQCIHCDLIRSLGVSVQLVLRLSKRK